MTAGFIKIHRSLIDHPVFKTAAERWAFVELIALAAWKPMTVRYKDRIITLERGQCAVSLRDFAARIGEWEDSKVLRFFEKLKKRGMIRRQSEAGVSVITICNYNKYQDDGNDTESQSEAPTEAGPKHHRSTEKEREEREEDSSPPTVPPKGVDEKPKRNRGSRLADHLGTNGTAPPCPDEFRSIATSFRVNADRAWPEFYDYWLAVPGQRGVKLDWTATWRNRCRQISGAVGSDPPLQPSLPALGPEDFARMKRAAMEKFSGSSN